MLTVEAAFAAVGLLARTPVRWGQPVAVDAPGVYIVTTPDAPAVSVAPIDPDRVDELLAARPELRLDRRRPTTVELTARLASMWVPGESIIYIGMAGTSLRQRIHDYYQTPLGARRPHAGGWPLKTLAILHNLQVHIATTADAADAEQELLDRFAAQLSPEQLIAHCEFERAMPFANLEHLPGRRKRHGITGARAPQQPARAASTGPPPTTPPSPSDPPPPLDSAPTGGSVRSQTVTANDIARGQIRIPVASKRLFPSGRETVRIALRGVELAARWDPGRSPDRERSGRITVRRHELGRLVRPGETLAITHHADGYQLE